MAVKNPRTRLANAVATATITGFALWAGIAASAEGSEEQLPPPPPPKEQTRFPVVDANGALLRDGKGRLVYMDVPRTPPAVTPTQLNGQTQGNEVGVGTCYVPAETVAAGGAIDLPNPNEVCTYDPLEPW